MKQEVTIAEEVYRGGFKEGFFWFGLLLIDDENFVLATLNIEVPFNLN